MNERYARLSMGLAALPLTVAAFVLAGWHGLTKVFWPFREEWQVGVALGSAVFLVWILWSWRPLVVWHGGRIASTLGLTALVLGQILVWKPLWHSEGCVEDDSLRTAQSLVCLAVWCAGCVLSWWGLRVWRNSRRTRALARRRRAMTPSAVRIAIGFALIPLLPGVFFIVMMAMEHFVTPNNAIEQLVAYEVCAVILAATWLRIWKERVQWTRIRRTRTGLLCAMLVMAALAPLAPSSNMALVDAIVSVIPLMASAVWFAGTARVWRLADLEVMDGGEARATCGQCGYDLRGLREVRCPECGWTATVDALVQRCLARARMNQD